jgi:hypothetical protein
MIVMIPAKSLATLITNAVRDNDPIAASRFAAYREFIISLSCAFINDEFAVTDRQRKSLRSWWAKNRLYNGPFT